MLSNLVHQLVQPFLQHDFVVLCVAWSISPILKVMHSSFGYLKMRPEAMNSFFLRIRIQILQVKRFIIVGFNTCMVAVAVAITVAVTIAIIALVLAQGKDFKTCLLQKKSQFHQSFGTFLRIKYILVGQIHPCFILGIMPCGNRRLPLIPHLFNPRISSSNPAFLGQRPHQIMILLSLHVYRSWHCMERIPQGQDIFPKKVIELGGSIWFSHPHCWVYVLTCHGLTSAETLSHSSLDGIVTLRPVGTICQQCEKLRKRRFCHCRWIHIQP
mmetsp:Transcript_17486/g.26453  ORF Transcript_17486/g.26453 Transcript_17486/m.26453 type:complete len:270 (-) Transcript_17486:452-1261(-)